MKKSLLVMLCMFSVATSSLAIDAFEKVMLRDTLIGAGGGMIIGLLSDKTFTWTLIGAISGAIFGYFDAEKGLIVYENGRFHYGLPVIEPRLLESTKTFGTPMLAYQMNLLKVKF